MPAHRIVAMDWLIEALIKLLEKKKITVVLDNAEKIDRHSRSDVIYSLCNLKSKNKLVLIVIANSKAFLKHLDRKVVSRFFPVTVEFKPYSAEKLYDIVKEKFDNETISALIAWESSKAGDCRLALRMLERFGVKNDVKSVLSQMEKLRL